MEFHATGRIKSSTNVKVLLQVFATQLHRVTVYEVRTSSYVVHRLKLTVLIICDIQTIQTEYFLLRMLQLIVVAFLLWFSESGAVRLSQASNGWTIDEDTQPSIKCTGFNANDTVTWSILQHQQSSTVIGSCAPSQTTCNSSDPNIELSRPSQFYSNLTIHSGHRELIGKSVACSLGTTTTGMIATTASSRIRVIRRGVITGCETTEDYSNSWTLPINCTIEGAFSSGNRYTCTWYLSYLGSRINSTTTLLIEHPEVPRQQYTSGHCIFTWQLPTADGDYTYQLQFFPGSLLPHTVKYVTIRSPTAPHTAPSCPEYVAENDTLICDCITNDPGSPPSLIEWSGFTSHQLTVHNVTRNWNGTVYTCTQIWGVRQFGHVSYTLRVTDPPSQPIITGYNTSHVLTVGDSVSLTCSIRGGNPPITNITFYCSEKGQMKYGGIFYPTSSSNTMKIDRVNASDTGIGCVCTGKWYPDPTRHFERAVRLKVAAAEPPRVEVLTLNGNSKSLTVSVEDNSPVILRCGASGRPKPSIRVVRVDTGQPLEVDTLHTSGQDENVQQYTLTTSARCQDAAVYRCEASNTDGADEKNITLFVNCFHQPSSNVGAAVGGGVAVAVLVVVAVVLGVFIYRMCYGNDHYARPQPRQEESNYTDLVLYEDVGNTQQQTVNDIKDPDPASPYVNHGADVDNEGVERNMDYVNTGSAESPGAALYDRLEPSSQESSNYTGLILNNDAGQDKARNEHDYQNTSYSSTGTSAAEGTSHF